MKVCKYCDKEGHTQFYCPEKPRKTFNTRGKYYKKFRDTRQDWLNTNMPDSGGFYYCYLCNKPLRRKPSDNYEVVMLDHVKSRSRNPELRYDMNNLKPACYNCNSAKGSLSLEQYKAKLAEQEYN